MHMTVHRHWLIAALNHQTLPDLPATQWPELLALAGSEGVLPYLDSRLHSYPALSTISSELRESISQAAKRAVLDQLPFYAEQQRIYQALNDDNMPFLVLKGAALGQWLYDSPTQRSITDLDIWFADRQAVNALANLLQPLGYIPVAAGGELTGLQRAFDKDLHGNKIRVDAHWSLFNSMVLANTLPFEEAYSRSQGIAIQNQPARALSLTDALINAIGHRALKQLSGQANTLKWLIDQHLLFKALDVDQWQQWLEQCKQAGISDLALEALEHSQRTFQTKAPVDVFKALAGNASQEKIKRTWFLSWPRYQWHEMKAVSPRLSIRLRWFKQKLLPNPEAMREGYGEGDPVWKFMLRRIGVGIKRLFS